MSSNPIAVKKIQGVVLQRPGTGAEEYLLPPGSTLADLLREARADPNDYDIRIDGNGVAEAVDLRPGMVVTLGPRRGPSRDAWKATVGTFKDDPAFEEMVRAGQAIREAEREAARKDAENDPS